MLSHLFFADDVLLFLKVDAVQCQEILRILDVYGCASSQQINFEKSGIQFSANTSAALQREVCDVMHIAPVKLDSRYLGLPACWERSKRETYNFIIEKVRDKLQGWKLKLLSSAVREILL